MSFTFNDYQEILALIDENNSEDCSTFINATGDIFDELSNADIEKILEFLDLSLGIDCDESISRMSISEINQFSEFMNEMLEELEEVW